MTDTELEVVEDDFQEPEENAGEHIIEYSRDRTKVVFDLKGEEYTAFKPKKTEEWFLELQMAMSSDDTGRLLVEMDRFLHKIVGAQTYKAIRARRLDDEDDVTWGDVAEIMREVFEIWTSEQDKPVRPTGRRSASSTGKRRTIKK